MKNKAIKVAILSLFLSTSSLLALSGVIASQTNNFIETSAEQHKDNYDKAPTYTGTYYDSISKTATEGLDGSLRTSLTSLIYPSGWYTYSGSGSNTLSSALQSADEDPTNSSNMVYLYTRDSVTKNAASSWNREHCWPQSLSNGNWGTSGAGTDILHIRPTYNTTNSTRGNSKYGNVSGGSNRQYNGMEYAETSSSYFEPLDSVKGDIARIIMYTWVAYKSKYSNMPAITSVFESYDTLLSWHTLDEPDALESNRNDYSESSKQQNRNPFVDHPEYAWKIFGEKCSSDVVNACETKYPSSDVKPTSISLNPSSLSLIIGEESTLSVTVLPSDASKAMSWSSSDTSIATVSDGLVTGIKEGTAIITATSTLDSSIKATCSVTVSQPLANGISATYDGECHPGETINENKVSVYLTYENGSKEPIESGYTITNSTRSFTYSDTTSGSYDFTVTYQTYSTKMNVPLTRNPYEEPGEKEYTINYSKCLTAGVSNDKDSPSTGSFTIDELEFEFVKAYCFTNGTSTYLSLGKNEDAYITNNDPFISPIKTISVSYAVKSPHGVIYISKDNNDFVEYSESLCTTDNYYYVKLSFSGVVMSSYINIISFTISTSGDESATNIANYIMYEDTTGQCTSKFTTARNLILSLDETELITFKTSSDYVISTARERYEAWATYLNENPYENATTNVNEKVEAENSPVIIIITLTFGVSALIFLVIKKKRSGVNE